MVWTVLFNYGLSWTLFERWVRFIVICYLVSSLQRYYPPMAALYCHFSGSSDMLKEEAGLVLPARVL